MILQHDYGLAIETIHELREGPFPGTHARYVLRSKVRLGCVEASKERAAIRDLLAALPRKPRVG